MSDPSIPVRTLGSLGAGRVRRAGELDGPAPVGDGEWRRSFVEDFGALDLVPGMPRASMRVLGWMVVCRPAIQSAQQIMDELALSAGSVSAAVNALRDDGLLERVMRSGERRVYYRLSAQGWERVLQARFRTVGAVRQAAERALQESRGEADHRLCELRDTYARVEAGMAALLSQTSEEREGGAVAAPGPPTPLVGQV
jgi:DNA-binding transcriptional regulator GbsR (MarR family)